MSQLFMSQKVNNKGGLQQYMAGALFEITFGRLSVEPYSFFSGGLKLFCPKRPSKNVDDFVQISSFNGQLASSGTDMTSLSKIKQGIASLSSFNNPKYIFHLAKMLVFKPLLHP